MKNSNWFNAMVEFKWTTKNISSTFGVRRFIAEQIQAVAWKNQNDAFNIANASRELCNQVGF